MNGLDKVIERLNHAHAYVDVNDKNIFYYVDCSVIQDYGQVETFDNEHNLKFLRCYPLWKELNHHE